VAKVHDTVSYRLVKGCPDYKVSSDGKVWSKRKFKHWTELKSKPNHDGYLRVSVFDSRGRRRAGFIHVLVLEAFVGKCPEGMECRHLNGVHADNRLENLRWGTHLKNMADQKRHGTHKIKAKGEANGYAKLTERLVKKIRKWYASGDYTQQAIADLLKVHQAQVSKIVLRKLWSHVT
jgi:predicted XRE-type DNA-binding protein